VVDTGGVSVDARVGQYLGGCGAASKSTVVFGFGMLAWMMGRRRRLES
jgi:hypothetical protein